MTLHILFKKNYNCVLNCSKSVKTNLSLSQKYLGEMQKKKKSFVQFAVILSGYIKA